MKHIDLFSGIGGFALAASWVWGEEYENVGHSEVEKYPCKVYHRHFPESECLGDVTKIDWTEERFRNIDLLTGGFPCQPHSVAGKRKASGDSRDLWGECARAVSVLRPRYALLENVPGLLVSERGRFFNRVISNLAEIGYDAEWYTVGAWQVGAHHKRDRIWIVACPADRIRQREASGRSGHLALKSEDVADTAGERSGEEREHIRRSAERTSGSSNNVAHADKQGSQGRNGGELCERAGQRTFGESSSQLRHPSLLGREREREARNGWDGFADADSIPDWAGGNIGQPWPVTEFERPSGEDVPNTNSGGCSPIIDSGSGTEEAGGREGDVEPRGAGEDDTNPLSDAEGSAHGEDRREGIGGRDTENGCERDEVRGDSPNVGGQRKPRERETIRLVRGVANGLPATMDGTLPVTDRVARLKGLGNAIVPQVAAVILQRIKLHMEH